MNIVLFFSMVFFSSLSLLKNTMLMSLVASQAVTVDSFGESPTVASLYPPTLHHSNPGALLALCQECNSGHCFFSRGRPHEYVVLGVTESFFLSLPFDHFGCMFSFQICSPKGYFHSRSANRHMILTGFGWIYSMRGKETAQFASSLHPSCWSSTSSWPHAAK